MRKGRNLHYIVWRWKMKLRITSKGICIKKFTKKKKEKKHLHTWNNNKL
jgi:hypothetical protein